MSDVDVTLTGDEALVLFELLQRWEDGNAIDPVLFPGERAALWNLSASLERLLANPFGSDYKDLVAAARTRLLEQEGDPLKD